MTETIISMSKVKAHDRCPGCGTLRLARTSEHEEATLYRLVERCSMCTWEYVAENVKLSA